MKTVLKTLGPKGIVAAFLLSCLIILALQNMDTISVRFLIWDVVMIKKIYLVFISAGVGGFAGVILGWNFKKSK